MRKALLLLFSSINLFTFGQYEFYNKGADVHVQTGALVHVQGTLTNDNGSTNGILQSDGIIEVKGDLENKTGATFQVGSDNSSTNRAVKFVGSGTQAIKGDLNTLGTASIYNLVIDKVSSADAVEMQTNVAVEGSIVFDNATTTSTYAPNVAGTTTTNQKGFLKTYDATTEYLLHLDNSNYDAVKGFPALVMNAAPATGYILTKGSQNSSSGGFERKITTANTDYIYPIGTTTKGFNAVELNFGVTGGGMPGGGGNIKAKFCNNTGYTGNIPYLYPQYPLPHDMNAIPADNDGYNRYFYNNPCNGNLPQWYILQNGVKDHGYWSFEEPTNSPLFKYQIEAFANTYTAEGRPDLTGPNVDTWRLIKHEAAYGASVAGSGVDWGNEIESSVSNMNDLLTYSKGMGCYTGNGIPGGLYTGFSHFGLAKAKSNNALPVELLAFTATPIDNQYIRLDWATALEVNNAGFWLQRSTDGINWTSITWVDGHDNSTVTNTYLYPDHAVTGGIVYYYRLKQTDNDGSFNYSNIVTAILTTQLTFNVMNFTPNPATDKSVLTITSINDQTISVDFFDVIGQKVVSTQQNISKGLNTIEFELSTLASGTYTAVVYSANETYTKKLMVTK